MMARPGAGAVTNASSSDYRMRHMAHLENIAGAEQAATDVDPVTVRKALEEILHSVPFRTSKQCQDMLRYVVEHSLRHEQESLRERVIGTEVFGRSSDYDTSEDPVVRVRAADIRKRLAQYYQSAAHNGVLVRIEIPSGSYRALFELLPNESAAPAAGHETNYAPPPAAHVQPSPTVVPIAEPQREISHPNYWKWAIWVTAVLLGVMMLGWFSYRKFYASQQSALDRFWAPVLSNSRPVLIYGGANAVYRLSDSFLDRYRKEHRL